MPTVLHFAIRILYRVLNLENYQQQNEHIEWPLTSGFKHGFPYEEGCKFMDTVLSQI